MILIAGTTSETCTKEGTICSENNASVCKNGTCISACSLRGMRECQCDAEEDNYCYLCCGNADHQCLPAHHHNILRPNGERWEREACSRCRMHGAELEGLPCDDTDSARLCITGRCSNSVCHTRQPGSFCDRKTTKFFNGVFGVLQSVLDSGGLSGLCIMFLDALLISRSPAFE
ncbi:hypothetical protein RB195_021469 [Necator americanus]|uniref:Disintegrin n=2 Tax=Necator americanus TaxID=51031 RepID=A0ABR1EB45_NECAM